LSIPAADIAAEENDFLLGTFDLFVDGAAA
jgi:hypothetical protein